MFKSCKRHTWIGIWPPKWFAFKRRIFNDERLPIQLGMLPVRWLSRRSSVNRLGLFWKPLGIGPLKKFLFKWKKVIFEELKQDGTEPKRLLLERSRIRRSTSLHNSIGIGPSKWFLAITILSKDVTFPIHVGSVPEKWLLSNCKNLGLVQLELVGSIWPLKLLFDNMRNSKKTKFPKEEGILPSNSFLDIFKDFKFGKIKPRFVGIGPCK